MADTHCHKHNEPTFKSFPDSSRKSDVKVTEQTGPSKLEDTVNKFVERKGDLAERQRYLRDKVSTMERSIPAMMAFNMWMSGQKCQDAPLCKIREIMNKFSPYPDPTEKLLQDLKKTVQDLNREISELHEKIINADVDIEEKGMEIESLELSNKEMDAELATLEKEISRSSNLSLHSIHSEDLICLSRIRQLGEEERSLKCCIRQLEEKEMAYRQQMESLLISKDFQNSLGGSQMARRIKELEISDRKWRYTYQTQKYNMHQMKKKIIEKSQKLADLENQCGTTKKDPGKKTPSFEEENKEEKTGDDEPLPMKKKPWTSWTKHCQNNTFPKKTSKCPPRSCCVPLPKNPGPNKNTCSCSSSSRVGCPPQNFVPSKKKFCADNPLCQPPPCANDSISCPPIKFSGRGCPSSLRKSACRCSCKGKCARGKSESPCNCGTESNSNYVPLLKKLDVQNLEESSDEEFCECDCG